MKRPATASVYTDFFKKTTVDANKAFTIETQHKHLHSLVAADGDCICDLRLATADASESRTYFLKTDVEPTSTLSRVASHNLYRIDTNPTSRQRFYTSKVRDRTHTRPMTPPQATLGFVSAISGRREADGEKRASLVPMTYYF